MFLAGLLPRSGETYVVYLARAWTTGRIVAEGLGIPLISEPGLREARIGEAAVA